MTALDPGTRMHTPRARPEREQTHPGTRARRPSLARVVLTCLGLAALSGCDAMKSEGLTPREYRRVLVEELCAPGEFYSECWWSSAALCHEELAFWVANCIPEVERVQPSEALRNGVLACLFHFHVAFLSAAMTIEEREECVDAKRWKHVPPGSEDAMVSLRKDWSRKVIVNLEDAPVIPELVPDTAPEPSPDTPPEPSPGAAVPDQAPAP